MKTLDDELAKEDMQRSSGHSRITDEEMKAVVNTVYKLL